MSDLIQSVELSPIYSDTNVSILPPIWHLLRHPFTSYQSGENCNSSTLMFNGDVRTTNLPLFCCNPTLRAASYLKLYPRTLYSPLEINMGSSVPLLTWFTIRPKGLAKSFVRMICTATVYIDSYDNNALLSQIVSASWVSKVIITETRDIEIG